MTQDFKTGLKRTWQAMDHFEKTDFHNPNRYHMYTLSLNEKSINKILAAYDAFQMQIEQISKESSEDINQLFLISNNIFAITKKERAP